MIGIGDGSGRGFSDSAHAQSQNQNAGQQPRAQRHIPDPAHGILHGGWVQCPDPRCPLRNLAIEAAGCNLIGGERGEGREEAVDGENDPGGRERVHAKHLEYARQQKRIQWGNPGGGSGLTLEGVGISVTGDQGFGDAAHLIAEREMILASAQVIGVGQRDVQDPYQEGEPKDSPARSKPGRGGLLCGRSSIVFSNRRLSHWQQFFDFIFFRKISSTGTVTFSSRPAAVHG